MPSEYTAPFLKALSTHPQELQSLSSTGQKCIGYFCTYTPVEIIHAAGFLPVRIAGGPGVVEKAYTLVPDFICPYMKRSLEKALAGEYDFLSGIVQAYTCDAACGLVNIWEENIGGDLFHTISLPYADSEASRLFFKAEIERLVFSMNQMGGTCTPDSLQSSLALYDEIRGRILDLHDAASGEAACLTASDIFIIVQAGGVTPPETFLEMLVQLDERLEEGAPVPAGGLPVLVSGSLVESPAVFETIAELGGRVVADDLCSGTRHLFPATGEGGDAVDRLMDRHFKRAPCPSRARARHRVLRIAAMAEKTGAEGIIFLVQKFCTPHLSDFPVLAEALKKRGLPCTLIEMDEAWSTGGQFRTRIEGFFEILE